MQVLFEKKKKKYIVYFSGTIRAIILRRKVVSGLYPENYDKMQLLYSGRQRKSGFTAVRELAQNKNRKRKMTVIKNRTEK